MPNGVPGSSRSSAALSASPIASIVSALRASSKPRAASHSLDAAARFGERHEIGREIHLEARGHVAEAQHEQGDVVVRRRHLGDVADQTVGERRPRSASAPAAPQRGREAPDARVDHLVAPLDHAVGVADERGVPRELESRVDHEPARHGAEQR